MDSQKESRGQKWGWPGIGSKNRDVGVLAEGSGNGCLFPFFSSITDTRKISNLKNPSLSSQEGETEA